MPVFSPVSKGSFLTRERLRDVPAPPEGDGPALSLGIAVCERGGYPPFAEAAFIRRLVAAGPKHGLRVFAFAPWTLDEEQGTVFAWSSRGAEWRRETLPAPSLVYDRAWPGDARERRLYREGLRQLLRSRPKVRLMNGRLPGKLEVYRSMRQDSRLAGLLPPTEPYEGTVSLRDWLAEHHGAAFLKPSHGSKGRRVIAVARHAEEPEMLRIQGRNAANIPFHLARIPEEEALSRIDKAIGSRAYLMQPMLDLRGTSGEPFDIRALMQRNGSGRWAVAGIAARCGRAHSVTANLHGGGKARRAKDYLTVLFGREHADRLHEELIEASEDVIDCLESKYGRFSELGLDFGIERSGRLWFLEANTKPGRASMACVGESAAADAVDRPLAYARYILLRPPGRVFHEFDPM